MDTDLMKKFEVIKMELRAIGEQLSDISGMSGEQLRQYKERTVQEVKATAKDVSNKAVQQAKIVDEYAHKNPWVIAAGLSVAGLIVGLLFSNNKTKK